MFLRLACEKEKKSVLELYNEAKKENFCVWNDEYPTMNEINEDFKTSNLFVYVDNDTIVGAISIVPINEMDDFLEWEIKDNVCEIARIVIKRLYQGQGLAEKMVKEIFKHCSNRGYTAIHLSCQCDNIPANKTYQKLGFKKVGKKFMYDNNYYLLEKSLAN